MAAVICTSIGDLCKGCFNIICVAPCKACGVSCTACCNGITQALTSPFFPYLLVTFGLNVAPVVFGVNSITSLGTAGCGSAAQWMLVNAGLAAIHMVASLYIVHKIRKDEHEPAAPAVMATTYGSEGGEAGKMETGTVYHHMVTPVDDTHASSWSRIKHVLCYDKGVALYILAALIWIVWQTIGLGRYLTIGGGCGSLGPHMMISLLCGWSYMSLVGIAFLCSLCCLRL
mmetsp:Transcript_14081/g.23899  ORF Transcript_14081/g.23899 Transcript_14081/m.23899 type:complete len:229 (-) Transcript_14081:273-959(-)